MLLEDDETAKKWLLVQELFPVPLQNFDSFDEISSEERITFVRHLRSSSSCRRRTHISEHRGKTQSPYEAEHVMNFDFFLSRSGFAGDARQPVSGGGRGPRRKITRAEEDEKRDAKQKSRISQAQREDRLALTYEMY